MTANRSDEVITVRPARLPSSETAHRPFLVASLLLAILVGFVLGIHVPVGRLTDSGSPERTLDLIQAHGQVQLLGFAGLFVIGMSLRLMPRFASARLAFGALVQPALYLIAGGLVIRAIVMPWTSGDIHSAFLLGSVFAVLLGSACFALVVGGTLSVESRRFDGSSLAFLLGALTLFGACALNALIAIDAVRAGNRALPYLADNALVLLEMFGFLFSFILGVALRAIPTMLGIERPQRGPVWLALLLFTASAVLAGSLLWIEYIAYSRTAAVGAGVGLTAFGAVLLSMVWFTGVTRQAANRIRPSSQASLWLIRSALLWMLAAGVTCVYYGVASIVNAEVPAQNGLDAVRHILGVGVVTILIVGMALMILPEVAMERQGATRQKQLAAFLFLMLNLAALLRVLPPLVSDRWTSDERNLSMAAAGTAAELALLLFAAYVIRLLWVHRSA